MEDSFLSILLIPFILVSVMLGFCNAETRLGCMDLERKALVKFRQGLLDPSDELSDWVGEDCCKWRGIGCNKTTGRVESLDLHNRYVNDDGTLHALGGEINPSLLVLVDLVYLDLSLNNFQGLQIPTFIGSLEKLTYLNLSGASFGGVISPHIGNLSRLLYLDLSNNDIGSDLKWLPGLSSLEYLNLGGLDLSKSAPYWLPTVNQLPSLLELHLPGCGLTILPLTLNHINFTSVSFLDLASNGFSSTIPPWLFKLTELTNLDLKSNNIGGELPEAIGSLSRLANLDLSENSNIGGQLPKNLGMLCNLQSLKLSDIKLTGEITDFIDSLSRCTNSSLESLDLGYNSLIGFLPTSLGYLRNLRILILLSNSFQGPIPESIGNLTSLREFYLANNKMGGLIPKTFGQLSSLVALDFSENTWEGVVTESHFEKLHSLREVRIYKVSPNISLIFNISSTWIPPFKLTYLYLRSIQLGPKFPTWLRNQTELATVVLNNARISDTIPDWFGQLDLLLDELDVAYNALSSRVPNSLRFSYAANVDLSSNLFEGPLPLWSSNITTLYLRSNQFSGPIPIIIGDVMPSLIDLDISWNGLSGRIPLYLGNLSVLETMVISNNHLSGEIPHFWNNIPELYIVDLSRNRLSGIIPKSINSLVSLEYLILSNNNLSGEIPHFWNNIPELYVVDLSNNRLSGIIPKSINSLVSLKYLILSNNNLSGELPSLQNCTDMKRLDLGDNEFAGKVPTWIGESMHSLLILRLSSNSFTGDIPPQLCDLSHLHILDLSHNKLSGPIPHCVGNLSGLKIFEVPDNHTDYHGKLNVVTKRKVMQYDSTLYLVNSLDLSNNDLTGEIPRELTTLIKLWTLNLSMNHLTGIIPSGIGNIQLLETLDLSLNKLSGPIPPSIVSLTFLDNLNLSYNNFSGTIPTANQFKTLVDPSIYEGNAALCGFPLSGCQGNGAPDAPDAPNENGEDDNNKLGLIISVVIGFIVGFWGVFGSLVIKKSWRSQYFQALEKMKYGVLDFISAISKHLQRGANHDI